MAVLMKIKNIIFIISGFFVLYFFVSYFFIPKILILHNAPKVQDYGSMVTYTKQDIPGGPINIGLIGNKEQVIQSLVAAGWNPADTITLHSSIDIGLSVILDHPYKDAPVSTLLYEGKKQDLAFEKPTGNSADQRHHVRFWLTKKQESDSHPLWLGAVSYDRGVGLSHNTGQITHHISPDIDADRLKLITDLTDADQLSSSYEILGIGATTDGRNGGGDPYFTDGKAIIGILK